MSIQPLHRDLRLQGVPRSRPGGLAPAPPRPSSCVVVDDLSGAAGAAALVSLQGRDLSTVVVLARRADTVQLCTLLAAGLRGAAVTTPQPRVERVGATPATTDLSAREVGVLRHVADGCSNREVGEHLGLSALTVKSHLARISRKLGTGDRAQLVAIALRAGLLG